MNNKIGSELLSGKRTFNIGEHKNLHRLTANTVTLEYLKFGIDTGNVSITYPENLINSGYTLVLPDRSGVNGEFLGVDDNNKLKWGNPNIINNIHYRYGTGLNTAVIDSTYTKGQIIFPENYEITITPTSTTSKLLIQLRCAYNASFSTDSAITFYIYKTINNIRTEVQVEANLGTLNATGSNRTQYITSTIIESETTDPIKISIAFAFNNIINIPAQAYNIGILGQEDYPHLPYNLQNRTGYTNYKNSIIVTDFEGSGAHSTLLSKSHDNESIYYNLGTLFLGSNFNSLNTNNTSSLSLITEEGISAPLLLGELQGNITSNYVITDNISCLNLTSNIMNTNIINSNIINTDKFKSNILTTNTLTSNVITSNMIHTYDIFTNNSLKTKDLDVYGNLHVHGTQTIVNTEILNIDDNIIIINADGNIELQAGLQANIDGNLYNLFFDVGLNSWSIYDKNLYLNKLFGNNISLSENVSAQWFNGNINSIFVNVSGNININDNYILDVSAIKFSDGTTLSSNLSNVVDEINILKEENERIKIKLNQLLNEHGMTPIP